MSQLRSLSKLYVSNLPWTVSSRELRQYFIGYGPVINASVIFDRNTGMSRGFGFVTFANGNSMEAALGVQSHVIDGHSILVQPCST